MRINVPLVVAWEVLDKHRFKRVAKETFFFVSRLARIDVMEGIVFYICEEVHVRQVDRYRIRCIGKGPCEMDGLRGPGIEPSV